MNSPILRDPVGLVERSPELAELALHSPALRKAIERGSPHAAYRALFWATHFGGRFKGDHRETARALLRHRRIFFKPLTSAPTMFTYNGFGSSLYGRFSSTPRRSLSLRIARRFFVVRCERVDRRSHDFQ